MRQYRSYLPLLILFTALGVLFLPNQAAAQGSTDLDLNLLEVELWPDFDEPSVLVLITGEFPPETQLPITFNWGLPADARVNVAARIDPSDNMIDDIEYIVGSDGLTITNPEFRFRIEYYVPYESDGVARNFEFTLPTGLSVDRLEVTVQQPASATRMSTMPAHELVQDRGDTLTYLILPTRSISAEQVVSLSVAYEMGSDALTADLFNSPPVVTPPAETSRFSDLNWPLLLAGIAGLGLSIYFIGSGLKEWREQSGKPGRRRKSAKPKPRRPRKRAAASRRPAAPPQPQSTGQVAFCHNCGAGVQTDDRFCRSCGTQVRDRE